MLLYREVPGPPPNLVVYFARGRALAKAVMMYKDAHGIWKFFNYLKFATDGVDDTIYHVMDEQDNNNFPLLENVDVRHTNMLLPRMYVPCRLCCSPSNIH